MSSTDKNSNKNKSRAIQNRRQNDGVPSPISSQVSNLRLPPQSIHAEQALLGSILIRPECLHDIVDLVHQESFYLPKHQAIFSAIIHLFTKSEPIDALTLSNCLTERKELERSGGLDYIGDYPNQYHLLLMLFITPRLFKKSTWLVL